MRSGHVKVMRGYLFLALEGKRLTVDGQNGSVDVHPTQARAGDWEMVLAQRPSQTLCVLGNHRVWCSQHREGPCG